MLLAFAPVFLWSIGSVCTARASAGFGPMATNRWRLLVAVLVLGGWVFLGPGFPRHAGSWGWLFVSGIIGMGLGDLAMLMAYRHVGPRITSTILLCLAVPITGAAEWLWIGTTLRRTDALFSGVLLMGVAMAVMPGARIPTRAGASRIKGLGFAALAALAQGISTALSRVAYHAAAMDGVGIDGATAAWQRMLGGLLLTVVAEQLGRQIAAAPPVTMAAEALAPVARPRERAAGWLAASIVLGPIFGLSAYQAALVRLPGALVQAISALTPVAVIPIAWGIDGDRPCWKGIVGSLIACAAAIGLALGR